MASNGCFKTWTYTVDRSPSAIYKTLPGIPTMCGDSTLMLYDTTSGGNWTTSNSHIATVGTNGAVFGVAAGHATITYTMPGGCISFEPISVNANPGSITVASGVSALCLSQNDTATLVDPSPGGAWSSSNATTVGSIDPVAGVLTGLGAGSTIVTYTIGTCFVTKAISVGTVIPTINATPVSVCAMGSASAALVAGTGYTPSGGKWTTGNALIASVNGTTGAVTGVAAGTVIMTYTAASSGCYVTQTETVFADTMASITGATAVCVGSVTNLTDAAPILSGKWSSSNTTVGTLGAYTGTFTASLTLAGSTIITYTDTAYGGCKAWASINVGSVIPTAIITPTLNAVCAGSSMILSDATAGGSWTTGDNTIALINATGGVDGLSAGTVNVSYTIAGCPATTTITVNPLPIAITGPSLVCIGSTTTLNGTPAGGTWTSSNLLKATIGSATGVVSGVFFGTVTVKYILATGCFISATDTISSDSASIVNDTVQICGGATRTMTLFPNEVDGYWTTSNPAIANINSAGLVTGTGSGTATIYYSSYGNCISASAVVTVNYVAPISGDPSSMCLTDNTVFLSDATAGGVWTSSAGSIVTVGSATGQLTGVAAGSANIIYTVPFIYNTITRIDTDYCNVTASITEIACPTPPGSTTGVNDVVSAQVYSLFPNPSNGNVTITQSVATDVTMQCSVMNQVGAIVYSGAVNFVSGTAHMNFSEVAPGIYLVLLHDKKGESQTLKVLIEKQRIKD